MDYIRAKQMGKEKWEWKWLNGHVCPFVIEYQLIHGYNCNT